MSIFDNCIRREDENYLTYFKQLYDFWYLYLVFDKTDRVYVCFSSEEYEIGDSPYKVKDFAPIFMSVEDHISLNRRLTELGWL